MSKTPINRRRRRVLSGTGAAIVGSLWISGTATANNPGRVYESHLSPTNIISVQSNASATATIHVVDGQAHVEIHVSCLRNGREVRFRCEKDNGLPGELTDVASFDLEGAVTEGLVRNETILTVTIDDERFIEGLDTDDCVIIVTTEEYPQGELAGLEFEEIKDADPDPGLNDSDSLTDWERSTDCDGMSDSVIRVDHVTTSLGNEYAPIHFTDLSPEEQEILRIVTEEGGYGTCDASDAFNRFDSRVIEHAIIQDSDCVYLERDCIYYGLYVETLDQVSSVLC